MGKKIVCTVLLCFFFLTLFSIRSIEPAKAGRIWIVDSKGLGDFTTVQAAVDVAGVGDTVFIHSGTYHEQVSVSKQISLTGENPFDTIIDVQSFYPTPYALRVEANSVVVKNLTLSNSMEGAFTHGRSGGVFLHSSNSCVVEDCIVTGNSEGINLYSSNDNEIISNLATNNGYGIALWGSSSGNLVKGNWVTNNDRGVDIGASSKNNTVTENYFFHPWGISLLVDDSDPGSSGADSVATGVVFRNNFVQNSTPNVNYAYGDSPQPVISWSNGGQGNFWEEYSGVDANGDGVGDTPYVVDQPSLPILIVKNITDPFPLMKPVNWLRGDINYDTVVNILDIGKIAKAFGASQSDPRWNARYDLNNDGTINILDISNAASSFGTRMTWPSS